MPERKEPIELKITSIEDMKEKGLAVQLNLDEDAWEFAAPPPRGVYPLKCFLGKNGDHAYRMDENDPNSLFCVVELECRVVNSGEFDDTPVFTKLSTIIRARKNTSQVASYLVKVGARKAIPNPATPADLAHVLKLVLKKEPTIKAELDWRGGYMGKDKKGDDAWVNVYNHYEDFPIDPEDSSKRVHIVTVTGQDGLPHEIRAMLGVTKFFGKDDKLPTCRAVTGAAVSLPRGVTTVASAVEEVEIPEFATAQMVNAKDKSAGAPVSQAEIDIMLES